MDVFKIAVKVFASADNFAPDQFVPVFHHWIQNQSVEGHRLIDVADYGHVASGPGTVLVSSEANFYTDREDKRLGLLYSRKLPLPGTFQERLQAVVREALKAAARLEAEPQLAGKLKFKTDEILIRLNDRLLAPPCDETVSAAKKDMEELGRRLFGTATVEPKWSDITLVEFTIRTTQVAALSDLISC
jgi:hypothetical protein